MPSVAVPLFVGISRRSMRKKLMKLLRFTVNINDPVKVEGMNLRCTLVSKARQNEDDQLRRKDGDIS
ncbi:MAG: hypothetical protein DRJ49_04275 [Thermoprotei archaeon]|nr:MAG: hypothetical protein DRJ49_04275 [Thermoprotei archaeon]